MQHQKSPAKYSMRRKARIFSLVSFFTGRAICDKIGAYVCLSACFAVDWTFMSWIYSNKMCLLFHPNIFFSSSTCSITIAATTPLGLFAVKIYMKNGTAHNRCVWIASSCASMKLNLMIRWCFDLTEQTQKSTQQMKERTRLILCIMILIA